MKNTENTDLEKDSQFWGLFLSCRSIDKANPLSSRLKGKLTTKACHNHQGRMANKTAQTTSICLHPRAGTDIVP